MTTEIIVSGARGRMGSAITEIARQDPEASLKAVLEHPERLQELEHLDCIREQDVQKIVTQSSGAVIIDFTNPDTTMQNLEAAKAKGNPMVIGTTGFSSQQQEELNNAAKNLPIFMAPNMGVGINVLLEFLPKLAELLGPDYDVEISEIHHKYKKDAPSGTAVRLGEVLGQSRGWEGYDFLRYSREGIIGERPQREIGVQTLRGGDVVGEHTVHFFGPGERIDVTHRVHSRNTFAQGAVRAAKWIQGKTPGKIYSMSDLFADILS